MDALAEVDLGQAIRTQRLAHVDQQPELDAVALRKADLLEDPAMGGGLAGQWLAHVGQLREQELEHRARHQLGHAPAAGRVVVQRPRVEALHQRDVVGRQERAEEARDEGRRGVRHVGVEIGHDVARRRVQGGGHGLPLAAGADRTADHPGPGLAGPDGRVVRRPVVEHDDLVDEPVAAVPGQEGLDHRPDHRADRRALVAGGDADRDGAAGAGLGLEDQVRREVPVVEGACHAHDSTRQAALR